LFSHSQIPTTTTNFVVIKFFGDRLVVSTIHGTPRTDLSTRDRLTVNFLKRSADVVNGKRHDQVFVSTEVIIQQKGHRVVPPVTV